MELTINVQVGVSPEVAELVRKAVAMIMSVRQPAEELEKAVLPAEELEKAVLPAEELEKAELPAEEASLPAKAPTMEDVRSAMHKARQRIEGENYKEQPDSDGYKKYHKQMTAAFKNISALLGADKPSALPEDKRMSFIEQCNEIIVKDDGTIGINVPF